MLKLATWCYSKHLWLSSLPLRNIHNNICILYNLHKRFMNLFMDIYYWLTICMKLQVNVQLATYFWVILQSFFIRGVCQVSSKVFDLLGVPTLRTMFVETSGWGTITSLTSIDAPQTPGLKSGTFETPRVIPTLGTRREHDIRARCDFSGPERTLNTFSSPHTLDQKASWHLLLWVRRQIVKFWGEKKDAFVMRH